MSSHFFDCKKGCRKTCWQTPEHVTNDVPLIKECAALIQEGDGEKLFTFLSQGKGESSNSFIFFNRVISWPEGMFYFMDGTPQGRKFYIEGLQRHNLPKIESFISSLPANV